MKICSAHCVLNKRHCKKGKYNVKLCIYIPPERKEYRTKYDMTPEEWERIKNPLLKEPQLRKIKKELKDLETQASNALDGLINPTFESFEQAYENQIYSIGKDPFVADWFDKYIEELAKENRSYVYREHLRTSKNSFLIFKPQLRFSQLTEEFLTKYLNWMYSKEKSEATIQSYFRNLRTIINYAIKKREISKDLNPFGINGFTIGSSNARKQALNKMQVIDLLNYELQKGSKEDLARDIFIFQYLSNGLNINDLCKLKQKNVKMNGKFIEFIRTKTRRTKKTTTTIRFFVRPESQAIIDKWGNKNRLPDDYLFPFYNSLENKNINTKVERYLIEDITVSLNKQLKVISNKLGFQFSITTGTARHSYPSVLNTEGVTITKIRQGMGHSSANITEVYIDSADDQTIIDLSDKLL